VLLQRSGPGKDIVIDEEDTIEARSADTGVTGARRSTVDERDEREHAWSRNSRALQHGRGTVRRAVVDNDDFALRDSIQAEQVGECSLQNGRSIVSGDD
jgi:hypothetical protein